MSRTGWRKRALLWSSPAPASVRKAAFRISGLRAESGPADEPILFDEYLRDPEARLEYWRQRAETHVQFSAAQPNVAHRAFARWEEAGTLRGVITQNIDGLHQLAGSRNVLELHGTARQVACLDCATRYDADANAATISRVAGGPPLRAVRRADQACDDLLRPVTVAGRVANGHRLGSRRGFVPGDRLVAGRHPGRRIAGPRQGIRCPPCHHQPRTDAPGWDRGPGYSRRNRRGGSTDSTTLLANAQERMPQ